MTTSLFSKSVCTYHIFRLDNFFSMNLQIDSICFFFIAFYS